MDTKLDYWKECISEAADECGLDLNPEQLECLADACDGAHENYGMAFYTPPWSERIEDIERESASKLKRLQSEFDNYVNNAEIAVKKALRQYDDTRVTIGEDGEVLRHCGRTERIQ